MTTNTPCIGTQTSGPYLVWARLLPRYLSIKATAGSLTTFNNQCFMFYTQQMSDHGDHEPRTHLGLRRPGSPRWWWGGSASGLGACWDLSRCLLPGWAQILWTAGMAPSLALFWLRLRLWLALVSSHWSPLSPSVGGRPGSGSWTLVVTEPEVGEGACPDITTRHQRESKTKKKNCLYVSKLYVW